MTNRRIAIGIDVGGSGVKAAAVGVSTGEIVGERHREVRAPAAPVGVGVPSVVMDGVTKTAASIDAGWFGFDAASLGTGLGSGLFSDGKLAPNTELGHMEIRAGTPSGDRPR